MRRYACAGAADKASEALDFETRGVFVFDISMSRSKIDDALPPVSTTMKTSQPRPRLEPLELKKTKQIQSEGYDFDAAPLVPINPAKPNSSKSDTSTLAGKFKAAWNIFFPPSERYSKKPRSAREEGKNRLRMILVADRCGMTQSSLYEMKHSIVQVLSDFVEVEGGEDLVDVSVTADGEAGTIYSVSVPVRRIKPSVRVAGAVAAASAPSSTVATTSSRTTAAAAASIRAGSAAAVSDSNEDEESAADGVSLEWETDPEADASARFPYGV